MEESLINNVNVQTRGNRFLVCTRLHFLMKIIELVFAFLAAGLLSGAEDIAKSVFKAEIVHGTTIGFIMINGLIVFAELTQPMGKAPLVLSSVFGSLMFTVSGVFLLQARQSTSAVSAGIICVLEGVLFFSDTFILWCCRSGYRTVE